MKTLKNLNYKIKTYSIKIEGYKRKITIPSNNKNSLLLILEINKINIEKQCRNGYCGSCRVILLNGNINYLHNQPIAYAHPKEIFPCCCYIASNITLLI